MKTSFASRHRALGFTLIEVMIVVAIVAILASIALPSYLESIRKSRRAEARAQLMEAMQYMQRFYSQNDNFKRAVGTEADMVLPDALMVVPRQGAQTYTIDFVTGTLQPGSFTLAAIPAGAMKGDRCGTLQINSAGRRTIVDARPGVTADDCWR
ncbi:type IV pilin protein [Variovorax sp. PBL-E5]|uniref:type IV pilin protein n=1 Tax=Variovorax sp. PBL-E5 TaxID=434014 RepID=UPI0013196F8D|nr:type IV pilin protein [Variovorax sp. PBL-E5]VTU26723.1 Serogroup A1 [Variovorax sp. PBL-E5]